MQLISPTALQKKKLKEMIQKLFPQYQYIKYGPCNIIFLSKSFWHFLFKRETVHITDMCTVYIPEQLEKLGYRLKEEADEICYHRVYNQYSHIVLDLLHHRASKVIDYLYDEYTNLKYGIQKNYYTERNMLPEKSYKLSEILFNSKKDSIVLSRISNVNIKQALKHWKNAASVLNHPVLLSKTLDLWFRPEIKQELRHIFDIRISYA